MQKNDYGGRHANTPLKLSVELDKLDDRFAYDTEKRFSVMFDMPANYRAKMILLDGGKVCMTIQAFSWNETLPLRKAMRYGSNHRCSRISFQVLKPILEEMIEDKRAEQLIRLETCSFDKRIIKV